MAVTQLVGAKVHRREDPRLITGHGHFIDDFTRTGAAYATFVRSPLAHARIKSIDVTDAAKAPGVVGVYTARDFKGQLAGTHPAAPAFVAEKKYVPERFPIAEKEVTYQGEIVAVVLAESKGQAADAANMIQVDYDDLPLVMDLEKSLAKGAPKAHEAGPDNVCWDFTYTPLDLTEAAFKEADVVVKERVLQNRLAPVPMEPRGVLADYEGFDKKLTMWLSSQNPHFIRLFVSGALGLSESQVRVISPDVGGGFGSKISPYPEDYLVPALSRMTARPVKWIETPTESIQNSTHGRGQFYDCEVAAKKDGTLLAMRVVQYVDVGAYHGTFGAFQPVACLMAGGGYKWKGISARTVGVLTNRVPTDPYRGAGRPEATHLVERMVDLVALELKMDTVDIRRKNFIQPEDFPFTQNFGLVVDSGDYERSLDRALELAGYDELRKKQADLRKQGRYFGIGLSTWIELCGFGPSAATAPATGGIALVESAQVRVTPTGSVIVYTGTHAHGQGHETTFGAHVAVVEIDAETGHAQLEKYVAVDDCGNIINPMIVDGQIHGGVAQAIAQALYEEVVYDEETGQLKTGTLLDYSIPGIGEIPAMSLDHTVTPSPTNDLGVKGIVEAGTIAASAAVINAVCDALSPLGIKHVDMPASPDRLWNMMKGARK